MHFICLNMSVSQVGKIGTCSIYTCVYYMNVPCTDIYLKGDYLSTSLSNIF